MALSCPNHNLPEYKLLETTLGKEATYAIFMANNEVLPSLEEAEKIVKFHSLREKKISQENYEKVNELVEELKDLEKDKIVKTVEDFFQVTKSRLLKLKKNRNYKRLKELLTPTEGINKLESIEDILKAADKAIDDSDGIMRRIRAIALGIVQTEHIVGLIKEDVKDIVKDKDNALENITTLQYYLYTLNDWKLSLEEAKQTFEDSPITTASINNVLGEIQSIENQIIKNDVAGLVEAFKPILIKPAEQFRKTIEDKLNYYQNLAKNTKSPENKKNYEKLAKAYEEKLKNFDFTIDENIASFLKGQRGDVNIYSAFLEAYSDNPDPILSSFAVWLKNNIQDINAEVAPIEVEYRNELSPIYDKLGKRFNPEDLGKQVIFEDRRVDWEGNEYKVITLLNPFKGYQADEQVFLNEIEALKELIYNGEDIDLNTEKLIAKKKEYTLWKLENMHMEYSPEFYKKYELWEDAVGQKLKEKVDAIFDKIKQIQAPSLTLGQELTDAELEEIDTLLSEYKQLGNVNNLDGTPKVGEALEEAEKMREIRKLNSKFYEWVDNIPAFEKAKQRHSEYIISQGITEDSLEYEDEMDKWLTANTRTVIKDEFYKIRQAKIDEISIILSKLKRDSKISADISELYEEMASLVYGFRDEDNQPVGTLIQEKGAERIKAAQESIEKLKELLTSISGLTPEEQNRLSTLFEIRNTGTITIEEQEELNDLLSKSKAEGLNERQKKRLFELFEEIQELQSRIPTEYYIDTFNNLSSKYGVTIDNSGLINGITPILDSPEIDKLLTHSDFKTWFDLNHIQVLRFNPETKQKEPKWERTYQWSRVVPNDNKYFEVRPSQKYSYRVVKEEFRTKKVVGKTVDNKGNFLPKEGKYKNEEYFRLKNSTNTTDKELFKLLEVHTKFLLEAQEDIPDKNKLWLDIPRRRKDATERNIKLLKSIANNPLSIPKIVWEGTKSKLESYIDFNEDEGNYETVFADKYGNEYTSVPIKYVGKRPTEDVSLDIYKSVMKYTYSAKVNKKLTELLPISNALERALSTKSFAPVDLTKRIAGKIGLFPKLRDNTRLDAIRRITRRVFEGEEKKMEFGKAFEAILGLVKGGTVLSTIAFDLPASVANVINAEWNNIVNSANGYFGIKDLAKAHLEFFSTYMPAFQKDYFENKISEESLQSQLFKQYEFIQGHSFEDELGEKLSQSKLKDFLALNWIRNHRQWGELFVQAVNGLSFLSATKVEQVLSDGSKNTISLLEAYELDKDGKIKLKEGVDKQWDFKGSSFKELKERIKLHNIRVHGNYMKDIDKPELETYTTASIFIMMKRFFTSMFLNRFEASNIKLTKYGVKADPRFNVRGGYRQGYLIQTMATITKEIESKLQTGEFQALTADEKRAILKSLSEMGMILFSYLALKLLFGYDPDDEDKWKKLKEKTWVELHIMYQIARLNVETSTFTNIYQYKDFIFDTPVIARTITNWLDVFKYAINQEQYKKDTFPYKEDEYKYKARLYKALGIEKVLKQTHEEEDELVKSYLKMRER